MVFAKMVLMCITFKGVMIVQELNFSKEYIDSYASPWEALAVYIVAKAAYDYRNDIHVINNAEYKIALLRQLYEDANPGKEKERLLKAVKRAEVKFLNAKKDIVQIEKFFTGEECKKYTSVDGKTILRKLKEELA